MRYLIAILCGLSLSAQAETVWWRTDGAAVIQEDTHSCSLYMYNNIQAVVISWSKARPEYISFNDARFHFTSDEPVTAAVRIGETWLKYDGGGKASGGGTLVTIPIEESDATIRDLLQHSSEIVAVFHNGDIVIGVNQSKVPALLAAVAKCRAAPSVR